MSKWNACHSLQPLSIKLWCGMGGGSKQVQDKGVIFMTEEAFFSNQNFLRVKKKKSIVFKETLKAKELYHILPLSR